MIQKRQRGATWVEYRNTVPKCAFQVPSTPPASTCCHASGQVSQHADDGSDCSEIGREGVQS
jgi:hypothetical protein